MPPKSQPVASAPTFQKDEKVMSFHMDMLYEAKIVGVQAANNVEAVAGDEWLYKVHYKGWKTKWDEWVGQDRLRKFTQETQELARQLKDQIGERHVGKGGKVVAAAKGKAGGPGGTGKATPGSELGSSARASEERTGAAALVGRAVPRRTRDFDLETEDQFHNRPSIKIPTPDHIKGILVDDWENVTKLQQLVPLPHEHPVSAILDDYLAHERKTKPAGSMELDIVEEMVAGLGEYFDKSLGRILLYRFERVQYLDLINEHWNNPESKHDSALDTYGAEHLARLIVALPELVAQTNMDQQSVNRLREELIRFANWLGKHTVQYFVSTYDTPSQEYIERARGPQPV